jgi:hypothetical protein
VRSGPRFLDMEQLVTTMYLRSAMAAALLVAATSCGDNFGSLDAPSEAAGSGTLAIDRTVESFASVPVGSTSAPVTFQLRNDGTVVTGVVIASLTGADAASFQITTDGCAGSALAPNESCDVSVAFVPVSPGAKAATLTASADPGGSVTANLDGTGLSLGSLALSTTTSALGDVLIGTTGATTSTFTISNAGGTATGSLAVQAAGANPTDFVVSADGCSGQTLAPAGSCTFTVALRPLSRGPKSAAFQVSAGPGGTVSGVVTGVGLAPASLSVEPQQRAFGSVVTGTTSAALELIVRNTGDVATGPLAHTFGSSPSVFATTGATTCTTAPLDAGASCTLALTFTPTAAGPHDDALTASASPGGAVSAPLSGTGIAPGGLTINPAAHDFANTNTGSFATAKQLTITNTGSTASGVLIASLAGSGAAAFQIIAGTDLCSGVSLAPATACTVTVTFAPASGGPAHASLHVASAAESVTATLSGVGIGPAALQLVPASRGFGAVVTGSQSAALAFTVTNFGGQASGVPTVGLTGAGAAAFAIVTNGCTSALGPSASCTVEVRFAPTAAGNSAATLSIVGAPGGTVSAALTGSGIDPGGIVIVPSAYAFPTTALGDTSAAQTLTVTNTGSAPTGTLAITATGDFAISANTCTTLAAGASCTFSTTFTPSTPGERSGEVTAFAAPGGTASAALLGVAIRRIEIVALDPAPVIDPYEFGPTIVDTTLARDVGITVRNNTASSQTLTLTPSFSGQFSVVGNTCGGTNTIDAGGTCYVTVRFRPTSTGTKTGSLVFSIGSGAHDAVTQTLTGTGIESLLLTSLAGTDFGAVPINTASTLSFRITNPAGSPTSGVVTMSVSGSALSLGGDGCTGTTLTAGASCVVDVTFAPLATGPITGTLTASASPGGAPAAGLTANAVSPTGAAPSDISLTPSSIAEDAPSGSIVGVLTTVDADASDSFIYALVGGAGSVDNAAFTISGASLHTAAPLDVESKSSYAIRVRSTDSGGQIFEKPLTITITNVDEMPVAVNDSATVTEDSSANAIDVLANDTDVDAGPKLVASVTQPAHGTVAITGAGTGLTYQPDANYAGGDSFSYTLNGGSIATVSITVTAVDDAPVAVADSATVAEDSGATSLDVLANDTDIDGGPKTISSVGTPAHGTATITLAGTRIEYRPSADYTGSDSFTYTLNGGSTATVSITVDPSDDPPVAVNDAATATEETATSVDVLANDTDIDGGSKVVASITQGTNGAVSITGGGTGVQYTPNANFTGTDTFTYTLNGGSTATVTMTVTNVDDAPVGLADGATVAEDAVATAIDVLANDTDIDAGPKTISSATDPANGAVVLLGPAGAHTGLTYEPDDNYCNTQSGGAVDTFSYTLNGGSSATVSVTVTCVNDAPVLASTIAGGALPEATYTEDGTPVVIDATLTISDVDSTNIVGATIAIANVQAGDVLSFTNTATITVVSNAGGVLTLTGSDTLASYQAALRSVRFSNTSQTPSTTRRNVTFQVEDGPGPNDLSNTIMDTVDVIAVSDAPVLAIASTPLSYTEDDTTGVLIDATLTVSDADSPNLASASVAVTGGLDPAAAAGDPIVDELVFVNTANLSGSYNRVSGVLALTCTSVCTVADIQAALRTVRFRSASQSPQTSKAVSVQATDTGGNASNLVTRAIAVTRTNDAPIVTTTATALAYTENQGPAAVDAGLTVVDPDLDQLSGATVTLVNYNTVGGTLSPTSGSGISGSFNPMTGVLTLSGAASVATYQGLLRTVTFSDGSDAPPATRSIAFAVTDASGTASNIATRTVSTTAVNDAPRLSNPPTFSYADFTENGSPVAIHTSLGVVDGDSANLTGATIQITTAYQSGADVLAFANTASITGSWDPATGTLTLTGTTTVANYGSALRAVTFSNTSENPSTTQRRITFTATDGAATSTPLEHRVNVMAVNDLPTVSAATPPNLTYTEGDAAKAMSGTLVVTDPDSATLAGATVEITSNFAAGEDELAYVSALGITGSFSNGTLTLTGAATVADYQTALRNVTYRNVSVAPSELTRTVTFRARDSAGGTLGAGSSTSIVVVATANAPTISGLDTLAYVENGGAVAIDSNVTITDPDSTGMSGATVRITGNYVFGQDALSMPSQAGISASFDAAQGTLTLSGSATRAAYEAALESVRYQNVSDNPSTSTRTVTWIVTDDTAVSSSAATSSITVQAVNDAPVVTAGGTLAYRGGDPHTPIDPALVVADVDSASLTGATVKLTTNYDPDFDSLGATLSAGIQGSIDQSTGTLTLSGTATVAEYQAVLRTVSFAHSQVDGTVQPLPRTVEWTVTDGAASSTVATSTIDITINELPIVTTTAGSTTYIEGAAAVVIDSGVTVTDADDVNLERAVVQVTSGFQTGQDVLSFTNQLGITGTWLPAVAALELTGTASKASYQAALRSVTFSHSGDTPVTSKTITFSAFDSLSANTWLPATKAITITPVNDAPAIANTSTLSFTEGDAAKVINAALVVSDADSTNLSSATIAVTANYQSGEDLLAFTPQLGITGSFNSTTATLTLSGTATVASYQTVLRTVTFANTSNAPATTARTISFTATDASAATSAALTSTVNVSAVNDGPGVTGPAALAANEDTTTAIPSLAITDPDAATNEVAVTLSVTNGTLSMSTLTGLTFSPASANNDGSADPSMAFTGSLSAVNAALATLTFRASPNFPGNAASDTAAFSISVSDQGNTGSGGVLLANHAITITVNQVNDAPAVVGEAYQTTPNVALEVSSSGQTVTPSNFVTGNLLSNDSSVEALQTIEISAVNGAAVIPGTPTTVTIPSGARVTMTSRGAFTYLPSAGSSSSDSFSYTVRDSGGGATDASNATVSISFVGPRTWFVANNAAAGGLGRSLDPFDTLAEAELVAGAGDTVFVFFGDGLSTGQSNGFDFLADNMTLQGHAVALTTRATVNGVANATLVPALLRPFVINTEASVPTISVASRSNITITGLSVAGGPGSDAINAVDATGTLSVTDNVFRGAGDVGIQLQQSTGALVLGIRNNDFSSDGVTYARAIQLVVNAATLQLDISNNSNLSGTNGAINLSSAGATTITAFANNMVLPTTASGAGSHAISIVKTAGTITFDATPGGTYQTVDGGTTTIGTSSDGVAGGGIFLGNVDGDLQFASLSVFADSTNGPNALTATNQAAFSPTTGFRLGVNAGTVVSNARKALDLAGVTVAMSFAELSATSTAGAIRLTNCAGFINATSGSLVDNSVSGAVFISSNSLSMTLGATISESGNSAAVRVENHGSPGVLTFDGPVNATAGSGLQFTGASGRYDFNGTNALNGGDAAIDILSSSGTFTFSPTTSITNPSGIAFFANNASGSIDYNGSITKNTDGRVIELQTVAGTIRFDGTVTGGSPSDGITMGGTGSVVFTGKLDIDSSSGTSPAFSVTGARIAATGAGSVLKGGTNTAVNIQNATIDAADVTFQSVSSTGGSATGVILVNTGTQGGLHVTGRDVAPLDGQPDPASGGSIDSKTGANAGAGTCSVGCGVYLNNTYDVQLAGMALSSHSNSAIRGVEVNSFRLAYSSINVNGTASGDSVSEVEGPIAFGTPGSANGLGGNSLIEAVTVRGGFEHNIEVYRHSGTMNLTIKGSTIQNNNPNNTGRGIHVETRAIAQTFVDIDGNTLSGNDGLGVYVFGAEGTVTHATIRNNQITGAAGIGNVEGIAVQNAHDADIFGSVTGNTVSGYPGAQIWVGQAINSATASSRLDVTVKGNTVSTLGAPLNHAILGVMSAVNSAPPSNACLLIDSNTINMTAPNSNGMSAIVIDTPWSGTPVYFATVTNNNIDLFSSPVAIPIFGIAMMGALGRFDFRNNDVDLLAGGSIPGIALRVENANSHLSRGISGAFDAVSIMNQNNPTVGGSVLQAAQPTFVNTVLPQPSTPTLPSTTPPP